MIACDLPKSSIRLFNQGWSYTKIAKHFGCSIETVRNYFKKWGCFKKWNGHSRSLRDEEIISLWNSGLGSEKISKILNTSPSTVLKRLERNGISARDKSFYVGPFCPSWKGGKRKRRGYVALLMKSHPFADKDGYVFEHRIVAEKILGRMLLRSEVVHHKDQNKSNNNPENLSVMTRAEHTRLHFKEVAK